jgi:nitroreductase
MKSSQHTSSNRSSDSSRRNFLKQSAVAGGSLLFLASASEGFGDDTPNAPYNDTLKTIHSLHTTHGNFQDKPIPEPALKAILQASIRAANASNNQSYSIIVVKDRKMMKSVCGYQGGCVLVFCADYNRMKASAESLGYHYEPDTITDFVTACTNTALAAQTATIAARSLGIDSLLTNGIHRGDLERQWRLLDLPQTHCFPLIALVLGYATQEQAYRTGRLDGAGLIHQEKYHALTKVETEGITRQYDDKNLHLGLNADWDAKGHKHYLDWFFKDWMGVGRKPSEQEAQMLRRLKRSNFIEQEKA